MGTPMNLGESIRKIRQAQGISQGEMQKRTGILRSYLSRVENGHTVPSFATLQRLSGALGVTLADFFTPESGPLPHPGADDARAESVSVHRVATLPLPSLHGWYTNMYTAQSTNATV